MKSIRLDTVLLAGCLLLSGCASTPAPIMILSDLGADSVAAGSMKGSIYTYTPGAKVDVLTNSVPAFNITAGAAMLLEGAETYPSGTVFCCMVSPETSVGSRVIAVETNNGLRFVAPDNGLLTGVVDRWGIARAHVCTNTRYHAAGDRSDINMGREVLGPVAAHWARGVDVAKFGSEITLIVRKPLPKLTVDSGRIQGTVLYVDDFGNAVTNIAVDAFQNSATSRWGTIFIERVGTLVVGRRFSDVDIGDRIALIMPSGSIELCINQGNFAEAYNFSAGDSVDVKLVITVPSL